MTVNYDKALEKAKDFYKSYKQKDSQLCADDFPEPKESEGGQIKTKVNSKSKGLSKETGVVPRPLSSMSNIELQEYGLILAEELEDDPYSWLVRHGFLEGIELDIGLSKNLKGPNPPIYL